MKRILVIILAAFAMAVGSIQANAASPKKTETVVFVSNMHCENCVKKVTDNISFEKGVKDLDVNLEKNTIKVTFDSSKNTKEKLAAAIKKLGYNAVESKESSAPSQKK